MQKKSDFDLLVIGAGSGGVRASRLAATKGMKVALVEMGALGGTCVNVGCVPKKLFFYGAHYASDFEDAKGFGWSTKHAPEFCWETLRDNKTAEIKRLNGVYKNLLVNSGVQLIEGQASFKNEKTIIVNDKEYTSKFVLIATGSCPYIPSFKGADLPITSNEAFYLDGLPKSVLIVGGGYIAVEFAGIFKGLGVNTVLSYRKEQLLRGFDSDIRAHLTHEIQKEGVKCLLNSNVKEINKTKTNTFDVTWNNGQVTNFDLVMYATGRKPNIAPLKLENAGIKKRDNGEIIVDKYFQTNVPGIYALGDVTGGLQLTPVALAEAICFVDNILGGNSTVSYEYIPTAVFSNPNVATVGYTEEEAQAQFKKIQVFKTEFRHLKHTLSGSPGKIFMKLLVDEATDKVIGCHMVGNDSGEIMQGIAVAMKAGATKKHFDQTMGIHPTAAEEFVTMRTPS